MIPHSKEYVSGLRVIPFTGSCLEKAGIMTDNLFKNVLLYDVFLYGLYFENL